MQGEYDEMNKQKQVTNENKGLIDDKMKKREEIKIKQDK